MSEQYSDDIGADNKATLVAAISASNNRQPSDFRTIWVGEKIHKKNGYADWLNIIGRLGIEESELRQPLEGLAPAQTIEMRGDLNLRQNRPEVPSFPSKAANLLGKLASRAFKRINRSAKPDPAKKIEGQYYL